MTPSSTRAVLTLKTAFRIADTHSPLRQKSTETRMLTFVRRLPIPPSLVNSQLWSISQWMFPLVFTSFTLSLYRSSSHNHHHITSQVIACLVFSVSVTRVDPRHFGFPECLIYIILPITQKKGKYSFEMRLWRSTQNIKWIDPVS